jgi:uncharacterized protein
VELTNRFRVAAPIDEAWALLTDVERIAPCLPGAQLTEIEGDEYRGLVKVKVGPITAQYKGAAHFLSRDDADHRAVLRAEGRDTRGQGNAAATITAQLTPDGDGTDVSVVTDLTITGRVAQFGRGILADVSSKLLGEFATRLESELTTSPPAPAATDAGSPDTRTTAAAGETNGHEAQRTARPQVRRIDSKPVDPVDLLDTAGVPLIRRLVPVAVVLLVLYLVFRRRP